MVVCMEVEKIQEVLLSKIILCHRIYENKSFTFRRLSN